MSARPSRGLVATTILLTVLSLAGRGIVFVRDFLIAFRFGASPESDAFFLVYNLWVRIGVSVQSAMPKVFLPEWQRAEQRGPNDAGRLLWSALLGIGLASSVTSLALLPWADEGVAFFLPAGTEAQRSLTYQMLLLAFPLLTICATAGIVTTVGHARSDFLRMEGATFLLAAGVVLALLAFAPAWGIRSAAAGLLAGGSLMLLYLLRWARATGLPMRVSRADAGLGGRLLLRVLATTTFGYSGGMALGAIQRWYYAQLPSGHLSHLEIAWRVVMLPQHLLLASVMTTMLPQFARSAAEPDIAERHRLIHRGAGVVLIFCVPGAAALASVADPVVRAAFRHGAFTAEDAASTATLLALLSAPGVLMTMRGVLANVLFAYGHFGAAMTLGTLDLVIFPVAATAWADQGARGMVLAQGLCDGVGLVLALAATTWLCGVSWLPLLTKAARLLLATAVASAASWFTRQGLALSELGPGPLVSAVDAAAGLSTFAAVFVPVAIALRLTEVRTALESLRNALSRRVAALRGRTGPS